MLEVVAGVEQKGVGLCLAAVLRSWPRSFGWGLGGWGTAFGTAIGLVGRIGYAGHWVGAAFGAALGCWVGLGRGLG